MLGIGINFVHIDPIKALFSTAAINGVTGAFTLPRRLKVVGWLSTVAMAAAAIIMFAAWPR